MTRLPKNRRPVHPGKILFENVLEPLGITREEAAERLGISYPRLSEIINGNRRVTPGTALRFARFTGTDSESWLKLQMNRDLWDALQSADMEDIERIESVS